MLDILMIGVPSANSEFLALKGPMLRAGSTMWMRRHLQCACGPPGVCTAV